MLYDKNKETKYQLYIDVVTLTRITKILSDNIINIHRLENKTSLQSLSHYKNI